MAFRATETLLSFPEGRTYSPLRQHKLRLYRFRINAKAHLLRCVSFFPQSSALREPCFSGGMLRLRLCIVRSFSGRQAENHINRNFLHWSAYLLRIFHPLFFLTKRNKNIQGKLFPVPLLQTCVLLSKQV